MATDRPDATESPYSVDAGHFQLELDAIASERDDGETALSIGAANVKVGLTAAMDLQLMFEPYVQRGGRSGVGDLTIRLKRNLWGYDGGSSAFGVMPFVRLPTAAAPIGTGHGEAGLIVPLALDAPAGFALAAMLEADLAHHDDHYGVDLIATASVGRALLGALAGYVELISATPLDAPADSALSGSLGMTLGLNDDLQLDAGGRLGLNAPAPDLALFMGASARY